jgi:hypothetical protein
LWESYKDKKEVRQSGQVYNLGTYSSGSNWRRMGRGRENWRKWHRFNTLLFPWTFPWEWINWGRCGFVTMHGVDQQKRRRAGTTDLTEILTNAIFLIAASYSVGCI